jgi:ATP-binding cassette subfamily C protein
MTPDTVPSRSTADFIGFFLRAYPLRTAFMIGLMVLAGLAESIGVLSLVPVLEVAADDGAPTSALGQTVMDILARVGLPSSLGGLLAAIVLAITVKSVVLYIALRQVGYTMAHVARDLRLRFMRALLHAKWSFFEQAPAGQYANAISIEVNRASAAYRESAAVMAAVLQVLAYLAVSVLISWQVTALTILFSGFLTLLLARFFRRSRMAGRAQTQHHKALSSRLLDVIQGLKPLKAMAKEALVWPLLKAETDGLNRAQQNLVRAVQGRQLFYEPIVTAMLALGLFLVLGVGERPLSQVLVLAVVFYRIMQHVNTIQAQYQTVVNGESALFSLLDEVEEAERQRENFGSVGDSHLEVHSRIELRDVCFAYGGVEVLRGVDLEIPVGTFVAITGESGSGKTTLADLVVGLREPDAGEVLVDGIPLQEIGHASWRRLIGYVPQELLAFNDTVQRNVTLGDETLSEDDVIRALHLAGAYDFVMARPGGLDSLVGERGGSLSGGQRQRLAIARALVWRPSLLILDEVTTALDPATEQAICDTLAGLGDEVTILAISHQPAIKRVADLAYSLSNGRLEPQPTRVRA